MESKDLVHVFLVSFIGQGHVNPLLRLGKRLASKGLLVTFSAPECIGKQMRKANNLTDDQLTPVGGGYIRFEFFDDGWSDDEKKRQDLDLYMAQLESTGRRVIPEMLKKHAELGRPVSCLVNTPFIPWVSDVAGELGIPSALLWIQSTACFSAYYHYHHNIIPFPTENNPEADVQLPCMPLLKYDEIPSFLHPHTPHAFLRRAILGQYKNLDKSFCVLMETFQELEQDVIDHVSKLCPVKAAGPLFKNPAAPTSSTIQGNIMKSDDCIEWLDSKPVSSVVYISFGSIVHLKQEQIDEFAHGLLDSGVSFLWVMKPPNKEYGFELHTLPGGFLEKAGAKGKVVQWSPQEQVLQHPSVACFVTHCGWNSTLESLTSGVPVVAFPRWGDQVLDAVYLCDVFKTGVRMCRGELSDDRIIPREEFTKCLSEAMVGPRAEEMKKNATKWRELAEAAVAEGGSSDQNLQDFVDEVKRRSVVVPFKLTVNETTKVLVEVNYCTSLSWSADGSTLFSGYTDGVIRVWGKGFSSSY